MTSKAGTRVCQCRLVVNISSWDIENTRKVLKLNVHFTNINGKCTQCTFPRKGKKACVGRTFVVLVLVVIVVLERAYVIQNETNSQRGFERFRWRLQNLVNKEIRDDITGSLEFSLKLSIVDTATGHSYWSVKGQSVKCTVKMVNRKHKAFQATEWEGE